jgi:hypothetical protein
MALSKGGDPEYTGLTPLKLRTFSVVTTDRQETATDASDRFPAMNLGRLKSAFSMLEPTILLRS